MRSENKECGNGKIVAIKERHLSENIPSKITRTERLGSISPFVCFFVRSTLCMVISLASLVCQRQSFLKTKILAGGSGEAASAPTSAFNAYLKFD